LAAKKSQRGNTKGTSKNTNNNRSSKNNNSTKTNKTTQKKQAEVVEENEVSLSAEISVWVIGACMLILELANFGLCGAVSYISNFFFGLFGVVQYILPIAVLFSAFFLYINEFKKRAVTKVVFGMLVLLCIGMFAQIFVGVDDKYDFKLLFENGFKDQSGGGILCGSLAFLLNKAIGEAGTCIVIVLSIIVCVVLFAEVSVINLIKGFTGEIMSSKDDDYDYDEFEDDRNYNNIKKRSRREEIVIEDFPDSNDKADINVKPQRKGSLLESISVLPSENKESVTPNRVVNKLPDDEDVHEITMDFPVNLPGENMDAFSIEHVDKDAVKAETKKTRGRKKNIVPTVLEADDNLSENDPPENVTTLEMFSDAEEVKPSDNTLTTSEKQALDSMENKTAKTEKNLSAKEVGKSDSDYKFPPIGLLKPGKSAGKTATGVVKENAVKLQEVLKSFGVNVTMTNYSCGPSVTRYEMVPEQGVKVSKITGLADDIMMNLAAQSIRIEAPIPGKSAVGIEIPNGERSGVGFRELIDTEKFIKHPSRIAFAVGKDIEGNVVVEDIAKMPHLLIAGATGSGKSVCTNTLIMSILYKAKPDEVKLILVDPKQVELKVYNGIPHLLTPVVTDPKKAAGALNWAVAEMTDRYQKFSEYNVRNIQGYNEKVEELKKSGEIEEMTIEKMPQIVIIVDELADLMMVAKAEVEEAIVRLAQLARAAGIHLVIATQRPSVDVVTGLIKANVPSRIALSVSSGIDSRTIIDTVGAEKLLGNGDMLFYPTMYPQPLRVQGAYISDDEVVKVVEFLKANNGESTYSEEMTNKITSSSASGAAGGYSDGGMADDKDEYFVQAGKFIIEKNKASIGMLQRMFKIGFNRAARIMDQLSEAGVVGPEVGTKPREVLMSIEQFEEYVDEYF
jgi:S-DNA-T family DNA segregation ATPase FtsK/SpoIIIE